VTVQEHPVNIINLCYVSRIVLKIAESSALGLYRVSEEQPEEALNHPTKDVNCLWLHRNTPCVSMEIYTQLV
jgi:hypothetical protein